MILRDIDIYDGNLIHGRFAYKYFRKKTLPIGNIVAFRAPMKVETEGMIDNEDLLNNDFIYCIERILLNISEYNFNLEIGEPLLLFIPK